MQFITYTYTDENNNNLRVEYILDINGTQKIKKFWVPSRLLRFGKWKELYDIIFKKIIKDNKLNPKDVGLVYSSAGDLNHYTYE